MDIFKKTMFAVTFLAVITASMAIPSVVESPGWNIRVRADPDAGEGGLVEIFIYTHQADPGTAYATNLSEGAGDTLAHGESGTLTGNVPYDTAFDIVLLFRFNVSQAYNSTGSTWMMDWVTGYMTCADLSIGADTVMSEVQTASNANYMWVQFYLNNSDSGYTISHNETVDVTDWTVKAFM